MHNLQPFKPVLRGALGGECLHLRPPPRAGPSPSAAHPSDGGDEPGPAMPTAAPQHWGHRRVLRTLSGVAAGWQDPAIWGKRG